MAVTKEELTKFLEGALDTYEWVPVNLHVLPGAIARELLTTFVVERIDSEKSLSRE